MTFLTQECISNPPINKKNKVRMPGEYALEKREIALNYGIKLSDDTSYVLATIAKKFKVKL